MSKSSIALYLLVGLSLQVSCVAPVRAGTMRFAPKVVVLTAFPPEWRSWRQESAYHYRSMTIAGLIKPLICSKRDVCVTESGEGEINAAISVVSLVTDRDLDVKKTIFIRSGIAGGVNVPTSPLGSVSINDWVISWAFGHHYLSDGHSLAWAPPGCADFSKPYDHPKHCTDYSRDSLENLAYRINPRLLSLALAAAGDVALANDSRARSLDRRFHLRQRPRILTGATVTGDDFWIGAENQKIAAHIVSLYTHGRSHYTNSAMEDLGDIAALKRFGLANHYLSIRGISDVDVPPPGETQESVWKSGNLYAGGLAEENAVRVVRAVISRLLVKN